MVLFIYIAFRFSERILINEENLTSYGESEMEKLSFINDIAEPV